MNIEHETDDRLKYAFLICIHSFVMVAPYLKIDVFCLSAQLIQAKMCLAEDLFPFVFYFFSWCSFFTGDKNIQTWIWPIFRRRTHSHFN